MVKKTLKHRKKEIESAFSEATTIELLELAIEKIKEGQDAVRPAASFTPVLWWLWGKGPRPVCSHCQGIMLKWQKKLNEWNPPKKSS